ncbi:FecR family protein [Pedobacter sp. MW01-1-1]|uniref:FecR family protein n=1 Tax=Pedobacter sp. MW01-1-1 TaxID=3383027 RepID=UPI003FF14DAD
MLNREFRIAELALKSLKNNLSATEQAELQQWLDLSEENRLMLEQFKEETALKNDLKKFTSVNSAKIFDKITAEIATNNTLKKPFIGSIKLYVSIAAAVAIAIVSFSIYRSQKQQSPTLLAHSKEIKAGGNHATLTLENGQEINLDNHAAENLSAVSGISIQNTDKGTLIYKVSASSDAEPAINTLSTPKGGQYQIELPDGTKVWLNALSTLRFPNTFTHSATRKVELTGEAYFEVKPDKTKPFLVSTQDQTLEVLGTHFNINAYGDEVSQRTTLVEGRVKLTNSYDGKNMLLHPGEQAVLSKSNVLNSNKADIQLALAWKNNLISFENETIENILPQLIRWYNIDVRYEGKKPTDRFSGSIQKFKNIAEVLNTLQLTNKIHFKIEGRSVIVMK